MLHERSEEPLRSVRGLDLTLGTLILFESNTIIVAGQPVAQD